MKVEIKHFELKDYITFLKLKISPATRKEFSRSLMGYLISGIKSVGSKNKYHRFSIYSDSKFVGFGAIFNLKGFYEISLFTLPQFRGKGIATEAARKLVEYSFKNLRLKKICGTVDHNNPALLIIAKRLGFRLIEENSGEKIFEKQNTERTFNILFVCRHNRFRSQVAEDYFNKVNKNKHIVAKSAGIFPGPPISERLKTIAKKFGIRLNGRPRGVDVNLLKWQDMIVAVSDDISSKLFNYGPYRNKVVEWKIEDEYEGLDEKIEDRIKRIIKKVDGLVKGLKI